MQLNNKGQYEVSIFDVKNKNDLAAELRNVVRAKIKQYRKYQQNHKYADSNPMDIILYREIFLAYQAYKKEFSQSCGYMMFYFLNEGLR